MALRFDGRVVIITGAGGGLGRTYALDFAKRGASVVVNDLGGEAHGTGASTSMADKVVAEIRAAGGKAVANYDSVEYGEKIVKTAIDNFGRVDVVVNNAGILRDKAFVNMTDEDWDLIHKVHLKGAYSVARAAWPYMRKEKYGRIINTSSNSGVYGSFGQANYSAAKMGLVGFSNTLALEGAKYNILANSLVPTAGSRLTQTVMPQDLVDALKPEYVTPLVVYLCHESCTDSGKVFEAGAGWFGTIQYYRSKGLALGLTTAEAVRDNWSKIVDMSHAKNFPNGREVTASLMEAMSAPPPAKKSPRPVGSTDKMDPELAKSYVPDEPATYTYTARDAIIYALGIGATTKPEDVKFIYEGSEDFTVFPTFVVAPGLLANHINDWPGVKFDLSRVLHGEQYIELLKPLPSDGELKSYTRVVDIVDKGSFALILANVETYDARTGDKLAVQQFATFERGFGNFGGARTSSVEKAIAPVPKRAPDAVVEQQTSPDQAALYRQGSGDMNPLHVDTDFAKMSGFKEPILHGLCSLGFAVRHVLKQYANNDVNLFKAVKVRFSKPVIPGQTLRTEMWKEGDRIHFQMLVKETGETVLSSCYVDLKPGSTGHAHATKTSSASTTSSSVKSAEVFKEIGERLKSQPDLPKKVQAILLYAIKQNGKEVAQFTVDLKNGAGAVYEGAPKNGEKASTTLTVEDEDFVKLATGKLNPQQAFMSGKIKVKGNIMLLQKLQGLMAAQKAKL